MERAIIKISYRHVIDASSTEKMEVNIFNASYNEFLLKCQAYNTAGKFKTFSEMVAADGRANSLHYKSGFAIDNFIAALKNNIPFVFDMQGRQIKFSEYRFEVIESHIADKTLHKVAVNYCTDNLTLLQCTGEYLLLAHGDKTTYLNAKNIIENTFMLQLHSGLSIYQYQSI